MAAWLDEGGGVDARYCREELTLLMRDGGRRLRAGCAEVRMLLQRGASVNLQNFVGYTALTGAALRGSTTVVQVLLDAPSTPRPTPR